VPSTAASELAFPSPGLRLLPAASPLRERVAGLAAGLGLHLHAPEGVGAGAGVGAGGPGAGDTAAVLVDLAAPGAGEALASLASPAGPGAGGGARPEVLGLVRLGAGLALPPGLTDVVDVEALERELPARLHLARARRAARAEGGAARAEGGAARGGGDAASLERAADVFAHVREGVALVDGQAAVLALNPAGERMLDVVEAEVRGRHVNALCRPADEAVLVDLVWRAARGEPTQEVDVAVRTAGGRRLTLSLSAGPLPEGAQPAGAVAVFSFRDVTTQRVLAEELRHTKEFLERLIDSSVDAIIAADVKGRIILFNKGAEAISGYGAADVLGRLHVEQLYPPGVARDVMRRLRAPQEGGVGRLSVCRQEILTRTGERVPVNMTASLLYEGGQEIASVGIFTDLRVRVQLERQLSDAQSRLEQSEKNAVIVALAGTAAHELNQPLTSVMGYAELLKRRLREGDPSYRPVDIIYREAERMAEIVRKIGKITRYETKAYIGQAQIVDLDKATSHEE
jgi:PAS domain S-box-containing protein